VLIDTHCHLADPAFAADRGAVVARMGAAGVGRALVVESVLAQLDATLAWVTGEPTLALATGCHPHDASQWTPDLAGRLAGAWRHPAVRAAGEMGLDYHYDHAPRDVQRAVFREQLALGVAAGLPIIIHAREADDDVVAILEEQPAATVVLHSFSSGPALREAGLANGWYFSFSGMVTFKSWHDVEAVTRVADDRLLVETDAPYLAPVPHRGRRNEPAFVAATAARVADLRGLTVERLAALTTANAERLFWPDISATTAHAHPTES
jgi:TatD DNase family protein